ncbi:hypothetical protein, variant 2 [Aphanomyces invadans]|uniref:Uncharacterized protein n=1 Tax=Aphanomyces invadans TaxID=157072 RepID=A0A024UD52_9STRA|nr:hypothetical protein, variant 2 [Aphanomyces invadans]ETW04140.1 hypothetical protein, variant 2 [Aphanomyces invadans]|eukprot:XP_008867096.1 hypothetical protein, variant 2 [Aphanomyces invadans]
MHPPPGTRKRYKTSHASHTNTKHPTRDVFCRFDRTHPAWNCCLHFWHRTMNPNGSSRHARHKLVATAVLIAGCSRGRAATSADSSSSTTEIGIACVDNGTTCVH